MDKIKVFEEVRWGSICQIIHISCKWYSITNKSTLAGGLCVFCKYSFCLCSHNYETFKTECKWTINHGKITNTCSPDIFSLNLWKCSWILQLCLNTAQHSTAQHSTAQHSTAQHTIKTHLNDITVEFKWVFVSIKIHITKKRMPTMTQTDIVNISVLVSYQLIYQSVQVTS